MIKKAGILLAASALVLTGATILPTAQAATSAPSLYMGWNTPPTWMDQKGTIQWATRTADVQSSKVGSNIILTYKSGDGSAIDCKTVGSGYGSSSGWKNVTPVSKACSLTQASLTFKVTSDMVGNSVQFSGNSYATKYLSRYLGTGSVQIGNTIQMVRSYAVKPAGTSVPTTPPVTTNPTQLNLPKIAWEGGNEYYKKFPDAVRGGWADPSFFPIGLWWAQYSNDSEVKWDKSMGINTYVVTNPKANYKLLESNNMSWIGTQLPGQPRDSKIWVGDFLDDEVDGRYSKTEGPAYLKSIVDGLPDHNKVRYTNYTGMVISWLNNNPEWATAAERYTNEFSDAQSIDAYWFSSGQCDWEDPHGSAYLTPFTKEGCRSSQNYGRTVDSLRAQDAKDGKIQPAYNFIENVDVAADGKSFNDLTPAQVKGAAINSIIHEARGLMWFNNSFGGKCATGNAIRQAQVNPNYPCKNTVMAMGEVNNQIKKLAPVLNTQSYKWTASTNAETMLKYKDNNGYLFAMPKDTATTNSKITFSLPAELKEKTITVVDENRTIAPNADGTFTDNFASKDSYHIYKIS